MTDSLNNKELVAVGHELAKALSTDTPIIDIAKILTRLAERLDCTTAALREKGKQCDALAAENAGLIKFITQECHVAHIEPETFYEEEITRYVSADGYQPETPATDAFLAEVRASTIPEGYVLVPQEMHLSSEAMEGVCFHCGDGDHKFGEFTDGTLFVGEVDYGDGKKVHGLHIATADYPEEGCATICEFAAQLQGAEHVSNRDELPVWVACSERMPDETQPVITVSDGGVVQRKVYQFCEGVWSDWYEQYGDVKADAFTHWMPLPEAPQQEV
ncbi:TPA: DUF551 domain-containing protein [Enterobacter soli]|nr:DUF551 domain-containing protein [Enterobacter soli]